MSPFLWNIQETAPGVRHVAPVFAEDVTDLAHRTVAVVGIDVEQNRDAARAVALQRELLVSGAGKFTRAALDGSLDVIGGHILRLSRNDGATQTRVESGSPPPFFAAMLIS